MNNIKQAENKSIIDTYFSLTRANKNKPAVKNEQSKPLELTEIKALTELVFPDEALDLSLFNRLLPIMELAAKAEHPSFDEKAQKGQAIRHAALLTIVFNSFREALSYLKKCEHGYSGNQLIHDACLFTLPSGSQWNVTVWKALIIKHINNPNLFKIFQNADAIEDYIKSHRKQLEEENSKKIEARFVLSYNQAYEQFKNKKLNKPQLKEVQQLLEAYLREQLGFPQQGKLTEEQNKALKNRLKNLTVQDKAQREHLITRSLEKESSQYKGIDDSTKETFVNAMRLKGKAQIDQAKHDENKAIFSEDTEFDQLNLYLNATRYKEYNKNIPAAELFTHLGISEAGYNEYLTLIPKDNALLIPDVCIDGEVLGHKGYQLKKLNPSDPRAAVLGKLTSCCQSLTGVGAACAKHGITNERGGFYVLCDIDPKTKKERIIAQCWAWRGLTNTLVFDSIESNINFSNKEGATKLISEFYINLADILVREKGVANVMVGFGGATPDDLKKIPAPSIYTETFSDGYSDAKKQGFLAIQGISLCPAFLSDNTNLPAKRITNSTTAKNRLMYVIHTQSLDVNIMVSCGLSHKALKDWIKKYKSTVALLNENNKKIVLEAFKHFELLIGFDNQTRINVLNDEYLNSQLCNKEFFIKAILADAENQSITQSGEGLKSILQLVEEEKRVDIINIISSELIKLIINSTYKLIAVLSSIPKDKRIDFIKNNIGDERVLSLIMHSLIHSPADIIELLYLAPEDEYYSELIKREEFQSIPNSIDSAFNLTALLLFVPFAKRIPFIKERFSDERIASFMLPLTTDQLLSLSHEIPSDEYFSKLFEREELQPLICSPPYARDLSILLRFIPNDMKTQFIKEKIGTVKTKALVKNYSDLELLTSDLPEDKVIEFAKEVSKDMNLSNSTELESLTSHVPEKQLFGFIKEVLGASKIEPLICTIHDLNRTLSKIPDDHRAEFMKDVVGSTKIKSIINDVHDLISVLDSVPQRHVKAVLNEVFGSEKIRALFNSMKAICLLQHSADKPFINDVLEYVDLSIIQSVHKLVWYHTSQDNYSSFILNVIGEEKILSMINDRSDLVILFNVLPEKSAIYFLNVLMKEEKLLSIINSADDLLSLLKEISQWKQLSFINDVILNTPLLLRVNSESLKNIPALIGHTLDEKEQSELQKSITIMNLCVKFQYHLNIFDQKLIQMMSEQSNGHTLAIQKLDTLCNNLRKAKSIFLENKDNNDIKQLIKDFKEQCIIHIADAKTVLGQHRGWIGAFAKFLADLFAWISPKLASTLGFFGKTDSAVKLELFENDFTDVSVNLPVAS